MTTTRINHTGHDHPNTTTARTACRKAMKAPVATLYPTAVVGKGKAVHLALISTGDNLYGVRCGAGMGRGVKADSALRYTGHQAIDAVTCKGCRTHV